MAKKNTFVINGKTYTAAPIDFNAMCALEDVGVSVMDMNKKPMSTARAYFALCYDGGDDAEAAGKEIEAHIINGGELTNLVNAMNAEIQKSGFFQALNKRQETETQTVPSETGKTEE